MALDVERDDVAVADVDDSGVVAGPEDDPLSLGGEEPQKSLRGLVAAVLGPFGVDYRPLDLVGLPPERRPHDV